MCTGEYSEKQTWGEIKEVKLVVNEKWSLFSSLIVYLKVKMLIHEMLKYMKCRPLNLKMKFATAVMEMVLSKN